MHTQDYHSMLKDELDTYIKLMFYPIVFSYEYMAAVPKCVKDDVCKDPRMPLHFQDIRNGFAYCLFTFYFHDGLQPNLSQSDQQIKDNFETVFIESLKRYYNGRV